MFQFLRPSKMSPLFCGLIVLLLLTTPPVLAESNFSNDDQTLFNQAVEDFRFSEFDVAITKFKQLRERYPQSLEVIESLGRTLEEAGYNEDAVNLYGLWLKESADQKSDSARFAWIGMANSLIKLKRESSAIESLRQWISYKPDDSAASVLYGGTLLNIKRYDDSAKVWDEMLSRVSTSSKDQAAAHYYRAFLAYIRGDMKLQRQQALLSLQKDPDGPYAKAAEQFKTAKPARKLGLTASATVEVFYSSNVELLPDLTTPTIGSSKSDVIVQPVLSLLYNFPKFGVGYAFNNSLHSKREDLDLGYHSLYGVWAYGRWMLLPRFEYMIFGNDFLTYGLGGDLSWTNGGLQLAYSMRYNSYNNNLKGSDLSRLGGFTNSVNAQQFWKHGEFIYSANTSLSSLAAKGDTAYGNSDSYWQTGLGGLAIWSRDRLRAQLSAATYLRKYKEAAPIFPSLVRKDSNINVGLKLHWLVLKKEKYEMTVTANTGWQKNNSNDTTKAYKEWRIGAGTQVDW